MKKIAICGPLGAGVTTVAQVFRDNNWYGFDFDNYRTEENLNPLPGFKLDWDKLNNQLLLGNSLSGIVVNDVRTAEQAKYLKNLGFSCVYIIRPGLEYIPVEPGVYEFYSKELKDLCDRLIENTGELDDLINDATSVFQSIDAE